MVKSAILPQKWSKICLKGLQGSTKGQNQLKKKYIRDPQGQQKASKIAKKGPKQAKKGQKIGKKLQLIEKVFNTPVKYRELS